MIFSFGRPFTISPRSLKPGLPATTPWFDTWWLVRKIQRPGTIRQWILMVSSPFTKYGDLMCFFVTSKAARSCWRVDGMEEYVCHVRDIETRWTSHPFGWWLWPSTVACDDLCYHLPQHVVEACWSNAEVRGHSIKTYRWGMFLCVCLFDWVNYNDLTNTSP